MPLKLVTTLTYSLHCIGEYIETENWYKGITDYILEAVASYGQLPDGYGSPVGIELYLHNLERNFDSMKGIPDHKKKAITDYINTFFVPSKQKSEFPDLNVLIGLYKKWLKEFPFELSFLSHLKPKFEKQMPILSGKGDTNLYSGFTSFSLISVKGLIDFLVSITEQILSEFNTLNLYQSGLITDADKIKLETFLNYRKLKSLVKLEKKS
ncbi:MAG: hypothetical protein EOP48_33455 [Sphingobacteriales bacterium]|nr:MAG: hypothetical protein EOP48_33455 [Sphingobacteriales bacterium]